MDLSNISFFHVETTGAVDTPTRSSPEREIVCVTLRKDQKLGFGEFIKMYVTGVINQVRKGSCLLFRLCDSWGGQHG